MDVSKQKLNILDKDFISKLKKNPHKIGLELNPKQLVKVLKEASKFYYAYSSKEIFNDKVYDILYDILKQKDPDNDYFDLVGTEEQVINKVKLPYWMGSMDKVKPDTRPLSHFFEKYKGPYLISEKLDGLSGLLIINTSNENNNSVSNKLNFKLFTRGDGSYGQDITGLLEYIQIFKGKTLKNKNIIDMITKLVYKYNSLVIRGEIIIDTKTFNEKYESKYPKARSLVAGTVNRKTIMSNIVKDLRFVGYEIINPELNPIKQFEFMNKINMYVAKSKTFKDLDQNKLKEMFLEYKSESEYEIDGIIITGQADKIHKRVTSGNPKHSVAFKMMLDEQTQQTEIINVEYNASKYGILIPRVQFKPIKIGGDTIMYATGFNAAFIKEHSLGPGAIIKIVRSGDVIPYIYNVVKGVDKWQQPSKDLGEWKWSNSGLDALLVNKNENVGVRLKRLVHFFTTLKIPGLKEGVVERLYNAGYDDIKKIINITPDMIADMEGFQLKSAVKLYKAIHNVIDNPISLDILMTASNCFEGGFGVKKFKMVLDKYPNLIKDGKVINLSIEDLIKIDGYSNKSAEQFLKYLPNFIQWLSRHNELKYTYEKTPVVESSGEKTYQGQNIVFTGIRDKNMESIIEKKGGKIGNTVNSKTTLVIVDDLNSNSSKAKKAKELGIKIITYEDAKKIIK